MPGGRPRMPGPCTSYIDEAPWTVQGEQRAPGNIQESPGEPATSGEPTESAAPVLKQTRSGQAHRVRGRWMNERALEAPGG